MPATTITCTFRCASRAKRALVAIALLASGLYGCGERQAPPPKIAADVSIRALWWSQAQMEGLNPNAPPPKATEVRLQKWEYTDPVGVPHPDKADVVVLLSADGATARDIRAGLEGQWKTGPIKNEASATWGEKTPLGQWQALTIEPGKPAALRATVDIASLMSGLEKSGRWPWAFRAVLTVRGAGSADALLTREVELPIRPGD